MLLNKWREQLLISKSWNTHMLDDPIVSEIRKIRREILESYGWDYRKMLEDAMKRQTASGFKVVVPRKKKPER